MKANKLMSIPRIILASIIALTYSGVLLSQNEVSLEDFQMSTEIVRNEFITELQDIPSDFSPKSIADFAPYYEGEKNLGKFEREYLQQVLFVQKITRENKDMTPEEYFKIDGTQGTGPVCFTKYYKGYLENLIATSEECSKVTADYSSAFARCALNEYNLYTVFESCMDRYKEK